MVFQAQQGVVIAGYYVSVLLGSFFMCTIFAHYSIECTGLHS